MNVVAFAIAESSYSSVISVSMTAVASSVVVTTLLVIRLLVSVFVLDIVGTVTPSTAITPADTRAILVSDACHNSIEPTHSAVDVLAVIPATGNPVQFVSVPDVGVPRAGVTRVGLVANTSDPEPVSSLITPFSSSEVVDANCASVHDVSASHPPAGLDHFSPVASAESAVRTCQLVPTASREAVLAPVQPARSHLESHIVSVATDPPPEITISPLHKIEVELIVFMFVQDTSVSCFPARADVLALSVLRLAKFVFTCRLNDAPVIQSFNVVFVDMVLN